VLNITPSIVGATGTLTAITNPALVLGAWQDFVYRFDCTQTASASLELDFNYTPDGSNPPGTADFDVYTDEIKVQQLVLQGSQCFVPAETCKSLFLRYRHGSNAYGFDYETDAAFYNQARIPAIFVNYLPEIESKLVPQPDGSQKLTSARVFKNYSLEFDEMPDAIAEALAIAFSHEAVLLGTTLANAVAYSVTDFAPDENIERDYNYRGAVASARLQVYNQQASYC
jgi:hypothetical protein